MKQVMTVRGAVDASGMGHFQPHEHLFVRQTPNGEKMPALRIENEELSIEELKLYYAAGGRTILDAQPVFGGRDAAALKRLSEASGVQIVTVTGFHLPAFYYPGNSVYEMDDGALRDLFLSELSEGTQEAKDTKAGAVKAAIGNDGAVGKSRELLRAAAYAAAKADVPLILHTEKGSGAVDAVELCGREGLRPERIAVCHVDRQADDYRPHEEIAAMGVYMEYDTVARYKYHDDESECRLIEHMLSLGYAERLLISLDTTAARLASYGGAPGLDFILKTFIPQLKACGMSDETLDLITVQNPARLFA